MMKMELMFVKYIQLNLKPPFYFKPLSRKMLAKAFKISFLDQLLLKKGNFPFPPQTLQPQKKYLTFSK